MAVLDIGTTACRLVVAEAAGGGRLRPCEDRQLMLGLGRAIRRDGRLGDGLLQLTVETLRRLKASASRAGAETLTATLSERLFTAQDGSHLHRCAEEVLQAPVRVVDAADDVLAAARAARFRLGLAWLPNLVDVDEHHVRAARLQPDGKLMVIEVPAGVRDLVGAGVDPLHPAAFARIGEGLCELVAPFAELAPLASPGGTALWWPVLTGVPAVTLGRAVTGACASIGDPTIDGLRLSRAMLADLEDDLLATRGERRLPGVDPAVVDDVALSVLMLRAVLERLAAPGVLVSNACPIEGRLRSELEIGADVATGFGPVPATPTDAAADGNAIALGAGVPVRRLSGVRTGLSSSIS